MNNIRFKIKYLKFKTIGAALLVCLAFCTVIVIYNLKVNPSHYSLDISTDMYPYSYINIYLKNGSLYYIGHDNTIEKLCDNVSNPNTSYSENDIQGILPISTYPTKDKNCFFFIVENDKVNTGTLYKYEKGKGTIKIDENISNNSSFIQNSNKIFYFKVSPASTDLGTLYSNENGKKTKISNERCKPGGYNISSDSSTVAYIESDSKTGQDLLYLKKANNKASLVTKNKNLSIVSMSSEGSVIFYTQSDSVNPSVAPELYSKIVGKAPELISTKVDNFLLSPKDLSIYYIGDNATSNKIGNLYYKELNKKPIKIDTNVLAFNFIYDVSSKENIKTYYESINNKEFLYTKRKNSSENTIYYSNNNSKPDMLFDLGASESYFDAIKNSAENSLIKVTQKNNEIVIDTIHLKNKKANSKIVINGSRIFPNYITYEEVFKNLYYQNVSSDKVTLSAYSIWDNKTKPLLTTQNSIDYFFLNKETIYYVSDNELWIKQPSQEAEKISQAAFAFIINDNVYFYKKIQSEKPSYELYKYVIGQAPKLIDSNLDSFR